MGDSVPKHTGPISLTDTHPRTEHLQNPTTHHLRKPRDGKPVPQRCSSCLSMQLSGSNSTPFFQMVKLIEAIFRAKVRRDMVGSIPFSTQIKNLAGSQDMLLLKY